MLKGQTRVNGSLDPFTRKKREASNNGSLDPFASKLLTVIFIGGLPIISKLSVDRTDHEIHSSAFYYVSTEPNGSGDPLSAIYDKSSDRTDLEIRCYLPATFFSQNGTGVPFAFSVLQSPKSAIAYFLIIFGIITVPYPQI